MNVNSPSYAVFVIDVAEKDAQDVLMTHVKRATDISLLPGLRTR